MRDYWLMQRGLKSTLFASRKAIITKSKKVLSAITRLLRQSLVFLDPERDARRLNFTKSLSLHWLHEAQWHLQEARRQKKVKLHLVNLVNFASNRLDYLGEWFGWTRVRWAIRRLREQKAGNVEENDELIKGAKALLDASVGHFKELREQKQKIFLRNTHPMDFIDCARLASELAKHLPKERLHLYKKTQSVS